jgi:hypothetical protein
MVQMACFTRHLPWDRFDCCEFLEGNLSLKGIEHTLVLSRAFGMDTTKG